MKNKGYTIIKINQQGEITLETLEKINGFQVKPKNKCNYKNIKVNSMVIIKPSFIEKVLKKKIKRKLEYYLNYIINLADDSDEDNTRIALGELEKFKETVEYKYRKFLDDKFINLLHKKIALIEHEIKIKLQNRVKQEKRRTIIVEDEEELVEERRRRR